MTFSSLPHDLVVMVLDTLDLTYADLKDLAKGFPVGSYHRVHMGYRRETQRLLEEREQYYLNLIRSNLFDFWNTPDSHFTENIIEAIFVSYGGHALEHVPDIFKTKEVCNRAVELDGYALFFVPEELKTFELCLTAVKTYPGVLRCVPVEFRTHELCLAAILGRPERHLDDVPDDVKTYDFCMTAVKHYGFNIFYVPRHLKTEEMCNIAVEQSGRNLAYVPKELQTFEMCKTAISKDASVFPYYIKDEFKTGEYIDEIAKIVIKKDPFMLSDISKEMRTFEMCKLAVELNPAVFSWVPEVHRTLELCTLVVLKRGCLGKDMPREYYPALLSVLRAAGHKYGA